ncbi:hypothetical protein [Paracoccus sp. MC1862]|uniref:hypothetical protein n=1 Tax=Paracoccus sp. MC1862 TaxID=2760307 RepID=UPI00178DB061|nr:hypothetical protein [Paracoccus sp. MC1862]MBB1498930.1 hypothetical protein [Paracoccus sp. MC1862]QQO46727.1 hypothetical protein JGR78_17225 [Paracoccus sp. MC1862]
MTDELIDAIDRLTTLYAWGKLDSDTRQTLTGLMANELKGMETVTGFLDHVRAMEIHRRDRHGRTNVRAQLNGWKGYVPALLQEGAGLIVADASQHEKLVKRGYVRIGDYPGDAREGRSSPRSYYQTTVGGKAQFRQGVAQTVHETWQGVDSRTGATTGGHHAGLVLGRRAERVAAQARRDSAKNDGLPAGDYLLPIFDEKMAVVGYERPLDPARVEKLPKDEHLGRMLGVWAAPEASLDVTPAKLAPSPPPCLSSRFRREKP